MSPMARIKNTTEPTTIPAMAPPDKPFFDLDAAAAVAVDEGDEEEDVADGVGTVVGNVMNAVIVGSTTLEHLCSAPAL